MSSLQHTRPKSPGRRAASSSQSPMSPSKRRFSEQAVPDSPAASRGAAWDFSGVRIHPHERVEQQSGTSVSTPADCSTGAAPTHAAREARPRIEMAVASFHRLARKDFAHAASRDGSPDDIPATADDQDALAPSVFERGTTGRGVHIRVSGGSPGGTPQYPDGVRWAQTITTNAPLFGQSSPYVDFIPPKDDKPFYFSDAGENATFSDNPKRKANGVTWDATLSLVGVKAQEVTRLDSVNYGFDISPSGTLSLHGPSTTGVASLVIHGDTLRSEFPNWVFSGGFAVPQVPGGAVHGDTGTA